MSFFALSEIRSYSLILVELLSNTLRHAFRVTERMRTYSLTNKESRLLTTSLEGYTFHVSKPNLKYNRQFVIVCQQHWRQFHACYCLSTNCQSGNQYHILLNGRDALFAYPESSLLTQCLSLPSDILCYQFDTRVSLIPNDQTIKSSFRL